MFVHTPKTGASAETTCSQGLSAPIPLWLLGLVALSGVLTAHILIPALPQAAADLHATSRAAQLTISVYIAGLAIGQLIHGPLADRFGQRHVLLIGLAIYVLTSIAATFSPSMEALIALRLIQSFGGGVGLVLARAIARRDVDAREGTRRLALMNLIITLGPVVSPLLGGTIASLAGWRVIFLLLALLGIANLCGTWALIPESRQPAAEFRTILKHYARLTITPAFVGYSVAGGCFTTSMYALIGAAPFILVHRFGFADDQIGGGLALSTVGIWIGSIVASRLIHHVSAQRLLSVGGVTVTTSAFAFLWLTYADQLTVVSLVAVMAIFLFGVGLSGPPALALAVGVNPFAVGSAAGLYGSAQMTIGALCSFAASLSSDPARGAVICPLLSGPSTIIVWTTKEEWNGSETQARGDHRQAA